MRVLLLCWTGDHHGQCECGKFLNQGKSGCRRCKLLGKTLENSTNMYIMETTASTLDILGKKDVLNLLSRICLT